MTIVAPLWKVPARLNWAMRLSAYIQLFLSLSRFEQ